MIEGGSARSDRTLDPAPVERLVPIGSSVEGRPIVARMLGAASGDLRMLIVSRQHGDEAGAQAAVTALWNDLPRATRGCLRAGTLTLAAVPSLNPDGANARTRRNALGVDLNRDHARLLAPETQALHRFVRRFRPSFVVDVHTFPSRRAHLVQRWGEIAEEVLVGIPTNPAATVVRCSERLAAHTVRTLERRGYRANDYLVFQRSGRVRLSTLTVQDLRNTVAIRYRIPTLLVEGRESNRTTRTRERSRLDSALQLGLATVLDGCVAEREWLLGHPPEVPREGEPVPIRARWGRAERPILFRYKDPRTGLVRRRELPEPSTRVLVEKVVRLPGAYAVRSDASELLEALDRQGFQSSPAENGLGSYAANGRTPSSLLQGTRISWTDGTPEVNSAYPARTRLFPTEQVGGQALALWLEPDSQFRGLLAPGHSWEISGAAVRTPLAPARSSRERFEPGAAPLAEARALRLESPSRTPGPHRRSGRMSRHRATRRPPTRAG